MAKLATARPVAFRGGRESIKLGSRLGSRAESATAGVRAEAASASLAVAEFGPGSGKGEFVSAGVLAQLISAELVRTRAATRVRATAKHEEADRAAGPQRDFRAGRGMDGVNSPAGRRGKGVS